MCILHGLKLNTIKFFKSNVYISKQIIYNVSSLNENFPKCFLKIWLGGKYTFLINI